MYQTWPIIGSAPTERFPSQREGERPENVENNMTSKDDDQDMQAVAPSRSTGIRFPIGKLVVGNAVVNDIVEAILALFTQFIVFEASRHIG